MKHKQEALKSGWSCPFCNHEGIESIVIHPDMEGTLVINEMECLSCEEVWEEVYQLSDLRKH